MSDRRRLRSAETEARIVRAATDLFLEQGYARTAMTEVAARAGVSERTVYVRFAGKAELLKRAIDVAVVGDVDAEPLSHRDWMARSMSAPTLRERIEAFADGVATMQARLAPLVAVGVEVEASEPVIAEQASNARQGTVHALQGFWGTAAKDGLLPPDADVAWLAETSMLLSASETALLRTRTFGADGYRDWLAESLHRLHSSRPV